MKKVYDNCCGIDVHKKLIVACFKQGSKQEVREFGATTRELLKLCGWLKDGDCEMVAMESTASFCKPLYNILEASGLDAIIISARHMKNVPGRKTDVKGAEWIADLLQHGLLQAGYIPDKDQRELRELVRYRKSLVGERTRELNRLQKMLEGANIHIRNLDDEINNFMKPEAKTASVAMQEMPGIGETSAQFQRISSHRGKKRAYVAVAHSMLTAIYHILKDGVVFKDLGADYYNQFNRERKINACLRKLEKLGYRTEVAAT